MNQRKSGFLDSTGKSSLSLTNENFPVQPNKARLSTHRNEKVDMSQDINAPGDFFQHKSPSKSVEHLNHTGPITELRWPLESEPSRDSSLEPSHVADGRVSLEVLSQIFSPYVRALYL